MFIQQKETAILKVTKNFFRDDDVLKDILEKNCIKKIILNDILDKFLIKDCSQI